MVSEKLYADRDPRALEPHYSRHVMAMTAEQLHWKSDIAAELSFRDKEIERLRAETGLLRSERDDLRSVHNATMIRIAELCGENISDEPRAKLACLAVSRLKDDADNLRAEVERLKAAAVPETASTLIRRTITAGMSLTFRAYSNGWNDCLDAMLAAAPQPPTVQAVTAAEVFAAFDEVSAAHETEKWTGDFVDNSTDGRRRRHEARNRVNELRAKLTQQPTAEPKEKPAERQEG